MSALAETAYGVLPEYIREDDDGTVFDLLYAVCSQADSTVAMMSDPDAAVDPWQAPSSRLTWLAALAGLDTTSVPASELRGFIASTTSRYRGCEAAIRQRVGLTLTGSKSVVIVTNYLANPNKIAVTTFASETPSSATTVAAIKAEIPAWMAATIVTNAAGQSYSQMAADYSTYGAMQATGKSYGTLSQEI